MFTVHTTPEEVKNATITGAGKSRDYSGIPISRTSRGNANWSEKSGVREIEGGIKLRLTGRVLFGYISVQILTKIHPF